MKPIKIELVIFNLPIDVANFFWRISVKTFESLGYSVVGVVEELHEDDDVLDEQNSNYHTIVADGIERYEPHASHGSL